MTDETKSRVLDCRLPGGPCHDAGLADVRHCYEPSDEIAAIIEYLRWAAAGWREVNQREAGFALTTAARDIELGHHLKDKTK